MSLESYGLTKITFNIRIGEMLLNSGVINKQQLDMALKAQKSMVNKNQSVLIGDIIREQFNVSKETIEDTFAKYLIYTVSQLFQEILHKDSFLSERIGDLNYLLNKVDICIPRWEIVGSTSNKVIDAEIVLLITSIDNKTITVNIPFEYTVEDQVANIDLLSAVEYVKTELLKAKGIASGIDLNNLGIRLPEVDGPVKVLFVDDEKNQREIIPKLIKKLGYIVETADSAENAIKLFEKEKFQLVITDLSMPGMDGVTLCENIKEINPTSVVYALSGFIATFGPDNLENTGFDGYFSKPVSFDELKGAMGNASDKIKAYDQT